MAGMASATIVGNLTRDPQTKFLPSGVQVTDFSVAVNSKFKDKEQVSYFDVTAWDKTADVAAKYLAKGRQVCVSGRLEQQRWTDKDGGNRSKVVLVCNQLVLLGSKRDGDGGDYHQPEPATESADDVPF